MSEPHFALGIGDLGRLYSLRLLRAFEAALLAQKNPGFQLLSRGEEAVAVGVAAALETRDPFLCSGRSIGAALARGVPTGMLLAELLGKDGGPNRGRAGRGHLSMTSVGLFGAHAVVGGNLSIAAGVALAQQYRKTGAVTLCLFGDGACGSGALHETMNLTALWKLPLVLVCSNNGYAVSTPVRDALACQKLSDLAAPFGIAAHDADGADVDAVLESVSSAVRAARDGRGPQFVVLDCPRLGSHSTLTKEERPTAEMDALRARDPLAICEARLRGKGAFDDHASAQIDVAVQREIALALEFAARAPWPDGNEAVASV